MAFKPRNPDVNFKNLISTLSRSKFQNENPPLYQVIKQLIDLSNQNKDNTSDLIAQLEASITNIITPGGGGLSDKTYVTGDNETASLPNSRQLVAGQYTTIDTSTPGQIKVNGHTWSVLTDGDLIEPELIFASGDVIMTHTP